VKKKKSVIEKEEDIFESTEADLVPPQSVSGAQTVQIEIKESVDKKEEDILEKKEEDILEKKEEDILESTEAGLMPTQNISGAQTVQSEKKETVDKKTVCF